MTSHIKIGLVGAGVFGGYHANKLAMLDRVKFTGVYDLSQEARDALAAKHNVMAFAALGDMLTVSDAVVIAAPASVHGQVGLTALQAGKHVLVEKPIATSAETGARMVELAKAQNLVLQVGHQERFVMQAIGVDAAPETPTRIEARRFGPWSPRGSDVSVTLDLMTHDLDMVIWLMGESPQDVTAHVRRIKSDHADKVDADLKFSNGKTAVLAASRVEEGRDRVMKIDYPSGRLEIDFVNKSFSNETGFDFNPDFANAPSARDSLGAGTAAFVASILDGAPIMVPGEAGLASLSAALKIDALLDDSGSSA